MKCCALARPALHRDVSSMRLDDLTHDGESEPGMTVGALPALVGPAEALEDARDMLGRDTDARVGHCERDASPPLTPPRHRPTSVPPRLRHRVLHPGTYG